VTQTDSRGSVADGHPGLHRPLAVGVLLVAGVLSLPLSALFLDGADTENWVLPAALVAMAVFGAIVGSVLPGLAGPYAGAARARVVGALTGVAMLALGTLVFFLLLNGFDGA
jgi:drug/metabolite transporter (DMT)-like permease